MWNEPTAHDLARLPGLYDTEHVPWPQKIVYEHFFLGGSDWFMVEYGPDDRVFFGFVILNGDRQNAEWGYTSFDELRAVRVAGIEIDRDLHWRARPAMSIELIRRACG